MKKMIIIGAAALVLILVVVTVLFLFVFNKEDKPKEVILTEFALGELYTNIADEGKILKISINIEHASDEELLAKLTANKSKIINNINAICRSKSFEDLGKKNSQERLAEEIREMVIEVTESDEEAITNVYFLVFIIQG